MSERAAQRWSGLRAGVRVLRAPQWLHFLALPAAAMSPSVAWAEGRGRLGLAMVAAAGALGWAYGLNAIADRGSDASAEKNPLVGVRAPGAAALVPVVMAGVVAMVGGVALGTVATVCAVISLAAGALYSVGPRAKALPVLGLIINILIFLPLLGLAWTPGVTMIGARLLVTTFVGLLAQNQLVHERADAVEDARGGALTTGRRLGEVGARLAVILIGIVGAIASIVIAPAPISAIVSAILFAAGAMVAARADAARARRQHRLVSLVGGAILWALSGR